MSQPGTPEPAVAEPTEDRGRRSRQLAPLVSLLVPLLLAAFVLPSALNVNQSNPSPTLEYAPVPASDDDPPPAIGNLNTLALARTTGLRSQGEGSGDGGGATPPPPQIDLPPLVKRSPSSKTCIGTPPRQTEDPYSPPCVAVFKGDNGGATYPGVTKTEVRVLWYFKAYNLGPDGTYWDLGRPPNPDKTEPDAIRNLRVWQQYFNQRFQTYNRFVRFYAFAGTGSDAESRRADAARNWDDIKPFATVIHAPVGEPYMEEMARRGVVNFTGSLDGGVYISAETYSAIKPLGWGSFASSELKAKTFASYVCRQLKDRPVSFSPSFRGQQRKYGFWYPVDPTFPEYTRYSEQVLPLLQQCGISVIPKSFRTAHWARGAANTQDSANAVADWQRNGVTTIIWVGSEEGGLSKAAGNAGYFPELVLSDDHFISGNANGDAQDPRSFANAVLVTDMPSFSRQEDTYCYQAYRDTAPSGDLTWGCFMYPSGLQLFTGIQAAGPKLTPKAMDKGLHAIPAVTSKDPTTPACFYLPGDYTCIKDATLKYWDGTRRPERVSYQQGPCWRSVDNGARYIAGDWPNKDRMATVDRTLAREPCNNSVRSVIVTTTAAN